MAKPSAAARWHVFHVVWRVPTALEGDYPRGLSSLRQQVLAWLDAFAEIVAALGHAVALGEAAEALARCLRGRWPAETAELPAYPAFRR